MYFADEENHKGLVNTIALVNAGIMKADGTVLKTGDDIRGSEIVMGSDRTPTGFLKEQASTYVRSFLDNESLFPIDTAKSTLAKVQELLLSESYTMYFDGHQGITNWTEEELTDITRRTNANGVIMHIHALVNGRVNRVVNAYINGENLKCAILLFTFATSTRLIISVWQKIIYM